MPVFYISATVVQLAECDAWRMCENMGDQRRLAGVVRLPGRSKPCNHQMNYSLENYFRTYFRRNSQILHQSNICVNTGDSPSEELQQTI